MNTAVSPAAGYAPAADSVLLHMCCGPCSIIPATQLRDEGFAPTGFFFNPNIHPFMEYSRRREAAVQAAERMSLPVIFHDESNPGEAWNLQAWLAAAVHTEEAAQELSGAGERARCLYCYRSRLRFTARMAKELGFSAFTTSLLYSRMQRHESIRAEGQRAAEENGVAFIYRDFRGGWQQGIDVSKAWGMYRQNYCGCIYSEAERFAKKLHAFAIRENKD